MAAGSGDSARLWDREAELAEISRALARAHGGEAGLLVLRGPAGIGKSALLQDAQRLAEEIGLVVLRARAAPVEREYPYGVVRQLFEPVLARGGPRAASLLSGAAAGARDVLGDAPGASAAQDTSFASLHALYWLTANLAAQAPLLLCVDDLPWCDDASLGYLEFLIRRLPGLPVLLAFAARTGDPGGPGVVDALAVDPLARVIQPPPLSEDAVTRMVHAELGVAADREFCAACHQATSGNPLLLTELVRALRAENVPPRADHAARVRQVGSVALGPSVARRLALLPEHARAVTRAMAVLGESVRREDLAGILELPAVTVEEMVTVLARAGILRDGERLSFIHPLVADAVRSALSPSELATLHDAAVATLAARGASAWEMAPHVMASPPGSQAGAAELLRQAAAWALGVGAPQAAVAYLSRAVAELDAGQDAAPLLLELGTAQLEAGDRAGVENLAQVIETATDLRIRAAARIALCVGLFNVGQYARSVDLLEQGIEEIAPTDPELAMRMEAQLLAAVHAIGPAAQGYRASVGDRMTRARSERQPPLSLPARLVLCSGALEEAMAGGTASRAVALAQQAFAGGEIMSAEGPDSPVYHSAICALIWCDELQGAVAAMTALLGEARKRGSPLGFMHASVWRAFANLRLGRLLDAEADARGAIEATQHYPPGPGTILAQAFLAGSLTEQGRLSEAELTLREVPDPPIAVSSFLLEQRARFYLAAGDYEAAARDMQRYHERDRQLRGLISSRRPALSLAPHRSLRARALIGLGDLAGARALVAEEMPLAARLGTARAVGMTRHVTGLLEAGDARIETLRRAAEELARSQSRLEYAAAVCDYGAALGRAGQPARARGPLREALEIARDARAEPLRDRAAEELKAAGARVSRPHATGAEALTAAERRIASMAAAGASNRDIAQALFVTVKTVETHLSRAYQKLSLTGRGQLASALGRDVPSTERLLDGRLAAPSAG